MPNNITKTTYSVSIDVAGTPAKTFKKLTALANWWPEEYIGPPLQLNTGFILRIGNSHYSKNKVIEFIPGKRVVYRAPFYPRGSHPGKGVLRKM